MHIILVSSLPASGICEHCQVDKGQLAPLPFALFRKTRTQAVLSARINHLLHPGGFGCGLRLSRLSLSLHVLRSEVVAVVAASPGIVLEKFGSAIRSEVELPAFDGRQRPRGVSEQPNVVYRGGELETTRNGKLTLNRSRKKQKQKYRQEYIRAFVHYTSAPVLTRTLTRIHNHHITGAPTYLQFQGSVRKLQMCH